MPSTKFLDFIFSLSGVDISLLLLSSKRKEGAPPNQGCALTQPNIFRKNRAKSDFLVFLIEKRLRTALALLQYSTGFLEVKESFQKF
jgi:hypothetical protein